MMGQSKTLGRSKTAGSIKIHNRQLIKNISDGNGRSQYSQDDMFIIPRSHEESQPQTRIPRNYSSCFVNGWLSEKSVKTIQEKIDYECSDIKEMYLRLMGSERQLQQDLNNVIENDIDMKNRKIHLLSKKWYEQTYHPLNNKIREEMNGKNYKKLEKEKRNQYTNYLNHQNNKEGHVFLDVFEKEEYDPLYLNSKRPGPLKGFQAIDLYGVMHKAATGKLADPLLHLQDKRNEEDRVVLACNLGETLSDKEIELRRLPVLPLIPLGRHGTKCSTWLGMELTDIQSDVRVRSQERRHGIRNNSTLCLHETNNPAKNVHFADDKRWQKKRPFPEKYDTTVELL